MALIYDWRTPAAFEGSNYGDTHIPTRDRGDLGMRSDVPFLMLQGGTDTNIPDWGACELSSYIGSSCTNWYVDDLGSGFTRPYHCDNAGSFGSPDGVGYPELTWQAYTSGQSYGTPWDPRLIATGPSGGGPTNWNLVWVQVQTHTTLMADRYVAWPTFHTFVQHLGWNVNVSAVPPKDSPQWVDEMAYGP
jgi:hypothetical protein